MIYGKKLCFREPYHVRNVASISKWMLSENAYINISSARIAQFFCTYWLIDFARTGMGFA